MKTLTLVVNRTSNFATLMLIVGLATLGCSKTTLPDGPTGTLSGKVTYNGSAPPTGSAISLIHEKTGFVAVGSIQADGSYSAQMKGQPELPVGAYQVSVTGPPAPEMTPDQMAAMYEGKTDPSGDSSNAIPAKYADVTTSGLTYDVKEGANTYDVPLTD
ncbi:MAG: carboxypeptidase-like regulatory domain-containing protein [Pirellulaceae bacterium]|nr:carboxypeptidase regulatory-like domain-containing protein [Planctomycetales bacterium]